MTLKDKIKRKQYIKELKQLDDRQLEDIGIPRYKIEDVVNKLWGKDR